MTILGPPVAAGPGEMGGGGTWTRFAAIYPDALFHRLSLLGVGKPGQHIVDLGTGSGTLARGFARRGCFVTGLDISDATMVDAEWLDAQCGVKIVYRCRPAEMTGLADGEADVVVAGRCWSWFNRPQAAREAQRLLSPGGAVALVQFDPVGLPGSLVQAAETLILSVAPRWQGTGRAVVRPDWLVDLASAGFDGLESFSFDVMVPFSHAAWRAQVREIASGSAGLDDAELVKLDTVLADHLHRDHPVQPLLVPHRCWAVVGRATRPSVTPASPVAPDQRPLTGMTVRSAGVFSKLRRRKTQ